MRSAFSYASPVMAMLCLGCATVDLPEKPAPRKGVGAVIGTNLAPMSDWSSEVTSVDLFNAARPWVSGSDEEFEDSRELALDDVGWVRSLQEGQRARTLMLSEAAHYPTGQYLVTYEGTGTFEFLYSNKTERVVSDGTGQYVLDVDRDHGGFSITILQTDPNDYLRNIHVLMPGGVCEDGKTLCEGDGDCGSGVCALFRENYEQQIFYPAFIESLEGYGVLRFMDWMQTNGSTQRSWSDRPTERRASWPTRGVPLEVMVELANRSGRDAWFCMPHLADDAYVESFARYVRDNLDTGRRAYVEYSNEVWNGLFPQADYAREQGVAAQLGSSDYDSQMHFYARRARQVHEIWERVFDGQQKRLVRVVASQAGNDWVSSTVLGFENSAKHADVLAIAPYFGADLGNPEQRAIVERMDVDALMTELQSQALPEAIDSIKSNARVAARYGIELVAYEGGQHLVGVQESEESEALNALFDAANRDPRMKTLYRDYLQAWRKNGGHTFVHFTSCEFPSKHGRWGAREWLQQPRQDAPKLDALLDYVAANPRWW